MKIGDAGGRDFAAALVSVAAKSSLRALSRTYHDFGELRTHVNPLLSEDLAEGRFVTLFVGRLLIDAGRRTLKKGMTDRMIECWVIPPVAAAAFAAGTADVLDVYSKPRDSACPVICLAERPVRLLKETRTPIPATAKHNRWVDYEYERAGTVDIFTFIEPLAEWREASVGKTKTKVDWAVETARLLEGRYPPRDRCDFGFTEGGLACGYAVDGGCEEFCGVLP